MGEEEKSEMPPEEAALAPRPTPPRDFLSQMLESKMMGSKEKGMTIGDSLAIASVIDYMEAREERKRGASKPPISEEIVKAIKEALPQPSTPQPNPQIEALQKQNEVLTTKLEQISSRLEKQESEDERKKLIEEATHPLQDQIKERDGTIQGLKEQIGTISKQLEKGPPQQGEFDTYLKTHERLKTAGFIKEPKEGTIVFGPDGIPIKGEIPAGVAYALYAIDKGAEILEKRIDAIATKLGIISQPATPSAPPEIKELIKLPPKPQPPPPPSPKEEAQPPPPTEEVKPPTPPTPLIQLPEKPIPTTEAVPISMGEPFTKEQLEKIKIAQLRKLAKKVAGSGKGKKVELIDRILASQKVEEETKEGKESEQGEAGAEASG